MEITLNGTSRTIAEQTSASDLIQSLGLANKRLALEINREIVPRSTYARHIIRPGDTVEIVQAIGGG
jgi:thiamine biosynthesis protein ThiS